MTSRGSAPGPSTIHDVARAAGVSRQTVTRAMNDMAGISTGTKDRVLAAARDLNYRPSRFGRGLVKNEHRTVGLVLDDLANPYYPELASAVIGAAGRGGWNVVVAERRHTSDQHRLLQDLAGQVDAVIGYLGPLSRSPGLELSGLPVVDIDPQQVIGSHGRVHLDMSAALRETVRHLRDHGVRRPIMVDVNADSRRTDRAVEFAAAFAAVGIPLEVVFAPDSSLPAGAAAVEAALQLRPDLDAILGFNDITACGVLSGLRRHRIDVPDQVRVVGVDGLSVGSYVTPELTSLAVDFGGVARAAVELVAELHERESATPGAAAPSRTVSHRLVVRGSG